MTIEEIVAARNAARAAFLALEALLTTDSQQDIYHNMHRRLDKVDADFLIIATEIGGPQTFEGGDK